MAAGAAESFHLCETRGSKEIWKWSVTLSPQFTPQVTDCCMWECTFQNHSKVRTTQDKDFRQFVLWRTFLSKPTHWVKDRSRLEEDWNKCKLETLSTNPLYRLLPLNLPPLLSFSDFLAVYLYRLNYFLRHLLSYFTKVSRKFVILVCASEIY